MSPRPRARRRETLILGAIVLTLCALILGWNVYQGNLQVDTSKRITRTSSSCEQVDRLYSDLITLEADSPRFTPARRAAMVTQRRDRLDAQGCP